jgi:putative ATP-binding cassette transporter
MLQLEVPESQSEGERIRLSSAAHGELDIRHLRLTTPAGQPLLDDFNLRVRHGERVLFSGDPDVTLALFKAVAGLWPWGKGTIDLPKGQEMAFIPQHPFLPPGSLRAVLCYPYVPEHYSGAALHRALECAGLAWLAPRLEETDDWNQVLPLRARQRLGLARLFLQQPPWVFLEEALDSFDAKGKACMLDMLRRELPNSTLLAIGRYGDEDHFYDRKLELRRAGQPGTQPALREA